MIADWNVHMNGLNPHTSLSLFFKMGFLLKQLIMSCVASELTWKNNNIAGKIISQTKTRRLLIVEKSVPCFVVKGKKKEWMRQFQSHHLTWERKKLMKMWHFHGNMWSRHRMRMWKPRKPQFNCFVSYMMKVPFGFH